MTTKSDWHPGFREYAACYALYLCLLALSGLAFFLLYDAAQYLFPVLLGWEHIVAAGLTVDLAIVVIGGSLFVLLILGESYLRTGVERRDLGRRFLRLAVPLVVASVVGYVLPVVLVILSRWFPGA